MKTERANLLARFLAIALMLVVTTSVRAQDSDTPSVDPPNEDQAGEEEDQTGEQEDQADEEGEVLAIVGADIHTVTQEVIRRGTILVRDGKIWKLGTDVEVPEGATVIEAHGQVVTPGFVAINMTRIAASSTVDDQNRLPDTLDPFDRNIQLALGVGITTGCLQLSGGGRGRRPGMPDERFPGLEQEEELLRFWALAEEESPEQVCPCCGLPVPGEPQTRRPPTASGPRHNAAVKMSFGHLDGMLIQETVFYDVSPGELTGPLNQFNWRQTIQQARQYLKELEEHEASVREGEQNSPPRKPVTDEVLKLVKKEIPLRTQVSTVAEIRDMIRLAEELDYDLVLERVTEGWVVADELSEAQVSVVITPRRRSQPSPGREDHTGSSIEMSGILEEAGVPFAVAALSSSVSTMGLAGRDLTSLPLEAAFAIRGGASERAALEGLTIVPARMMGLDDRIGSLEVGKDADLLILNGSPLDYRTYVEVAIVNGHVCYDRDRDRVYPVFER